jgi:predicted tellurium resistance membrane protein TerC
MSEIHIGVSACLLGEQVRYDGGHKRNALLLDEMASHVSFVPVRRELAMFTPLFLVLIAIGTYILVALDSIPAVFGVTDEPFIVFAANAFALLGLRAPNYLVTGLLDRLVYLSIVRGFIGIKLVLHPKPHD